MTAEGLLCRQYIGWERDHPPMVRGISALIEDAPFNIADQDVYYWYYATQVLHHYGGSPGGVGTRSCGGVAQCPGKKTGKESGSCIRDRWGKNAGRPTQLAFRSIALEGITVTCRFMMWQHHHRVNNRP